MRNALITVMFLTIIFGGFNSSIGTRQTTKTPRARVHLWETRNHKGALWETTSSSTALDFEVKLGARILKYKDGYYVHTIHRQFPKTCGPASLAMIIKQLGIVIQPRSSRRRFLLPVDVDLTKPERLSTAFKVSKWPMERCPSPHLF